MRGATTNFRYASRGSLFQPTLPVRGATGLQEAMKTAVEFQPTLPVRGATIPLPLATLIDIISTHAPRAGSDGVRVRCPGTVSDFNPRSPCGERLVNFWMVSAAHIFQPTLPVRGATASTNKFEALILYHKYNFGIIP